MTGFLRALALHVMLPLTTRLMAITNRLLEADRKAEAARKRKVGP